MPLEPDAREGLPEHSRLDELVLVVGEDQVEAAAVDLEAWPSSSSPWPSTRCASPAGPVPTGFQAVSSPGLFAFQSAKSRGSSFSAFGSCSSTWSGRWPESRPYSGKLATRK